jgi:hypothetical protein
MLGKKAYIGGEFVKERFDELQPIKFKGIRTIVGDCIAALYNGKTLRIGDCPSAAKLDPSVNQIQIKHMTCRHSGTMYIVSTHDKLYKRNVTDLGSQNKQVDVSFQEEEVPRLRPDETIIGIETGQDFVVLVS